MGGKQIQQECPKCKQPTYMLSYTIHGQSTIRTLYRMCDKCKMIFKSELKEVVI